MSDDQHSFLYVKGIRGPSEIDGLRGAFELDDYTFDASKTEHSLTFLLDQGASASRFLAQFNSLSRDVSMEVVNLGGESGDERTSAIVMQDMTYSVIAQDSEFLQVTVDFRTFTETTTDTLGTSETWGFDYKANKDLTNPLTFSEDQATTASSGATDWYMIIDNMSGDVQKKGFKGAFKVEDFDVSVSRDAKGLPQYDGLTVYFEPGSAEDEMLRQLMLNKAVGKVELVGRDAEGDQVVYDLRLAGGKIDSLAVSSSDTDTITLDFSKYSLTTKDDDGNDITTGYDLVKQVVKGAQLDAAVAGNEKGFGGHEEHWFAKITGLQGTNKAGIEVTDVSYESVAGQPFGNVTLTLDPGNNEAALLKNLLNSDKGLSWSLSDIISSDKGTVTEKTLILDRAKILSYERDSSGFLTVRLDPTAMSLTTALADKTVETVSQDAKGNVGDTALKDVSYKQGSFQPIEGLTYSLVISGLDGGARNGIKGSFAIDDLSFNISRDQNGNILAPDLSLSLDLGSSENDLLHDLVSHQGLTMRLVGANDVGRTLYDLRLTDAQISGLTHVNVDSDILDLAISRYSLTMTGPNDTATTSGRDMLTNVSISTPLTEATAVLHDQSQGSTDVRTVMAIANIKGMNLLQGYEGTFDVGFSAVGLSSIAGSQPSISSLDLRFDPGSALPDFLKEVTAGKERNFSLYDLASAGKDFHLISETDATSAFVNHLSFSSDDGVGISLTTGVLGIANTNTLDAKNAFAVNALTGKDGATSTSVASNQGVGAADVVVDSDYYMTLAGLDGGVDDPAHEHAFVIDSFEFSIDRPVSSKLGQFQPGHPTFSGITITFDAGDNADELLKLFHDGTVLKTADISGDGDLDGDTGTVLDFLMGNAKVTDFERGQYFDTLTLSVDQLTIKTFSDGADGVDSNLFGWDFVKQISL